MKKNAYSQALHARLINRILLASMIVVIVAFASAQLRALGIGWTVRDVLQLLCVIFIAGIAVVRNRLKTKTKALLLIVAFSLGALPGVYTLGMLAGTILLFPTTAVIVAVFYSGRVTVIYILLCLLFCLLVAINFCTGITTLPFDAELLLTDYFHWSVYISCLCIFFVVAGVTIHNFRKTMDLLMEKIVDQRDKLEKSNGELRQALKDVKRLSGLLPICSYCKKIRDGKGYWSQIENYIRDHSEAEFSHGICRECAEKHVPDMKLYGDDE